MSRRLSFLVWRVAFFFYCWYETTFKSNPCGQEASSPELGGSEYTLEDLALLEMLLKPPALETQVGGEMILSDPIWPSSDYRTKCTMPESCPTF